jgi:ribosomal protein L11 methyltransferase
VNTYLSLHCVLPESVEEELPQILGERPVLGIEIGDARCGEISAAVFFAAGNRDAADEVRALLEEFGAREIRIDDLEAEDWLAAYRERARPFPVGDRWWIDPDPGTFSPAPAGRRRLVIEPRTAFGSGSHESTQLILLELERLEVDGATILDLGTGSGILAIAAARLGGRRIVAVDIDEDAIWVARETANLQEQRPGIHYVLGPPDCLGAVDFDIVLCNMIFTNMLPVLPQLQGLVAPDGVAVLSGLLATDASDITESLRSHRLEVTGERVLGEWTSLVVVVSGR